METVGDRKFLDIPGSAVHELPPLLLRDRVQPNSLERMVTLAEEIVASDSIIPDLALHGAQPDAILEQHKYGLAIQLAEHYVKFLDHWKWGESIIEWIRQCEVTFESKPALRPLLRPDVWPNVAQSSFVTLLSDKAIPSSGVDLHDAVGFRLTFRQPPPIDYFSEKFLILLNSAIAKNAYETWVQKAVKAPRSPPSDFTSS